MREIDKKTVRKLVIFAAWYALILLMLAATLAQPAEAAPLAQATTTPSPTPETSYKVELSSGNYMEIVRSVSYGQAGIVFGLMILAGILILKMVFDINSHYIN